MELLHARWAKGYFVCGGFDPDPAKFPIHLRTSPHAIQDILIATKVFCQETIAAIGPYVCAIKPNSAFFEGLGRGGLEVLAEVISYAHYSAPDIPVILDGKRGDIGNTNIGYRKAAFDWLGADALTVNPYMGFEDGIQPLTEDPSKGIFVLCRTSNKSAREFQDLMTGEGFAAMRLFERVALNVRGGWNQNKNCGLVIGATNPGELNGIRKLVGDLPFLIPGIGAQGGDIEKTVQAGKDSLGRGMVINISRSMLYASQGEDYAEAARTEVLRVNSLVSDALETASTIPTIC